MLLCCFRPYKDYSLQDWLILAVIWYFFVDKDSSLSIEDLVDEYSTFFFAGEFGFKIQSCVCFDYSL